MLGSQKFKKKIDWNNEKSSSGIKQSSAPYSLPASAAREKTKTAAHERESEKRSASEQ